MASNVKFKWDWKGFGSGYVVTMKNQPAVKAELEATAERIRLAAQNAVAPGGNDFEVISKTLKRAPYVTVRAKTKRGQRAEEKRRVLSRAYAAVLK